MGTLLKLLVVLVLWYTGILSQLLIIAGGILIWAGSILAPNIFIGGF
jgi:hypothetical protein